MRLYIRTSMQFSNCLSIPLFFGIASVAPTFTTVYFGKNFSDTYFLMEMFSITVLFISWANVIRTQYLIPSQKDNIYILSTICGAIINVIVNIVLIPIYGSIGAVIRTICAEFIVAMIQTIFVKNDLPIILYFLDSIYFLCSGLIMYICVRLVYSFLGISLLSLIIQVVLGFAIYVFTTIIILLKIDTLLSFYLKNIKNSVFHHYKQKSE